MIRVNATTGEMFLYGIVGSVNVGGDFDEMDVIDALDQIGNKRAIVRINSPGGLVDAGIPIFNALKRHAGGVDTVNDGLAASIASVIAMAGEKRTTAKGSRWMIHRALSGVYGNANDIRKVLTQLEIYDASIVEIYQSVMADSTKIDEWLDAETWFTSQQSVDAGFATEVEGEAVQQSRIAAWMRNPPADFIAACAGQQPARIRPRALSQRFYSR